ncbi:MAG: hypothetical protein IH973_14010 [Myxococcales bacterium]|nr:hypothetical protein [Myxococcales bacterium]
MPFTSIGAHSRQHFSDFGIPDDRLVYGSHIVDNEFFVDQAKQLDGRRAELMSEFGLAPTDKVIFYPVKFFAKKQPLRLIVPHDDTGVLAEALARLASDEPLRRKF